MSTKLSPTVPPIYRDCRRLLVHTESMVQRFARYHKYTVDTDLRQQAMSIMRGVHRAVYDRVQQGKHIQALVWAVDDYKLSLQLAMEVGAFVTGKMSSSLPSSAKFAAFELALTLASTIGKQCGGWAKARHDAVAVRAQLSPSHLASEICALNPHHSSNYFRACSELNIQCVHHFQNCFKTRLSASTQGFVKAFAAHARIFGKLVHAARARNVVNCMQHLFNVTVPQYLIEVFGNNVFVVQIVGCVKSGDFHKNSKRQKVQLSQALQRILHNLSHALEHDFCALNIARLRRFMPAAQEQNQSTIALHEINAIAGTHENTHFKQRAFNRLNIAQIPLSRLLESAVNCSLGHAVFKVLQPFCKNFSLLNKIHVRIVSKWIQSVNLCRVQSLGCGEQWLVIGQQSVSSLLMPASDHCASAPCKPNIEPCIIGQKRGVCLSARPASLSASTTWASLLGRKPWQLLGFIAPQLNALNTRLAGLVKAKLRYLLGWATPLQACWLALRECAARGFPQRADAQNILALCRQFKQRLERQFQQWQREQQQPQQYQPCAAGSLVRSRQWSAVW